MQLLITIVSIFTTRNTSILGLIIMVFSFTSRAQSTCSGSLGSPVFFENFGTPSTCYSSTPLSAGTTNYTFKGPGPGSNKNPPNDGEYVVWCGSTAPDWNWGLWHQTYYDHTTGTGSGTGANMLIINASWTTGEFYRRAITGLCPNTNYTFSIYVANMADLDSELGICPSGSIKPDLAFNIYNSGTSTLLASNNTGQINLSSDFTWNYYDFSFVTGAAQTSVDVVLQNLAGGGCGNDLALDDISVRACGPTLSAALSPSSTVSAGTSVTLDGTIGSGYTSPVYQWQSSTDGVTWTDISGATSIDYTIPSVVTADAKQYRLLSSENGNISNANCRIVSNVVTLNVTPLAIKENSLMATFISEKVVELVWYSDGSGSCKFDIYGSYDGIHYDLLNTVSCINPRLYLYTHDFEGYADCMHYFKVRENSNDEVVSWSNVAYAEDNRDSDKLVLFPNPVASNSVFTVYSRNAFYKIELFDLNGKSIRSIKTNNEFIVELNIGDLSGGLYLVKVETRAGVLFDKIQVK